MEEEASGAIVWEQVGADEVLNRFAITLNGVPFLGGTIAALIQDGLIKKRFARVELCERKPGSSCSSDEGMVAPRSEVGVPALLLCIGRSVVDRGALAGRWVIGGAHPPPGPSGGV